MQKKNMLVSIIVALVIVVGIAYYMNGQKGPGGVKIGSLSAITGPIVSLVEQINQELNRLPGDPDENHWAQPLCRRLRLHLQAQRGLAAYTVRNYMTDLLPFWYFLDSHPEQNFTTIDRPFLRTYLHWLLTDARPMDGGRNRMPSVHKTIFGYRPQSVARKLSALRMLFGFLAREGDISSNHAASLSTARVAHRLPTFLGIEEAADLMDAPSGTKPTALRDRALLEMLYGAGLRVRELTDLNVTDLELAQHQARATGKGSKQRLVIIGIHAIAAIETYLHDGRPFLRAPRDNGALFLNSQGGRLTPRSVQQLVKKYASKAGIEASVHPHTLRHSFATHLLDGGADLRVVQELLGHSTPTTTEIYTHVTQTSARRTYVAAHPRANHTVQNQFLDNS